MDFSITFRKMDATDALKAYAKDRMEKIKKYFPDPIACHVTLSTERHQHRVDVNVQLHNGFHVSGHESTENMYSSIDLVSAKIERQVRKYKDKLRNHKKERVLEAIPVRHAVVSESEHDSDASSPAPKPDVRSSEIAAQSMSVDEAIMQLNLAHRAFLVFQDENSGKIAVLYRRAEENHYGLIDTGASK